MRKDNYNQYIGAELQITDKDVMKKMEKFWWRLRYADENPEGTGNYIAWVDHTEYEIELCDGSTSKLT